jgi:hypothetical protein
MARNGRLALAAAAVLLPFAVNGRFVTPVRKQEEVPRGLEARVGHCSGVGRGSSEGVLHGRRGVNADHDYRVNEQLRFVQLTPPGSACSMAIGTGLTEMAPGSLEGLQLVVSDIHQAREELVARGVAVSEVQEYPWGLFVSFSDPDGNKWSVQGIPNRT